MKKQLTLLLVLCMILGVFSGCSKVESETVPVVSSETVSTSASEPVEQEESVAPVEPDNIEAVPNKLPENYPMIVENGATLTAFQSANPMLPSIGDYGELPWFQELTKRTGISFDWTMTSWASVSEQFSILVAADELPNLVMAGSYSNGINYAVENNIFVDLGPYLYEYAPDYKAITQLDYVRPLVYSEEGNIIGFYEVGKEAFVPNSGMLVRGDMLKEQGLDVPITYDQYEDTMLKLKDAYDLEAPIMVSLSNIAWICGGYGVKNDFSLAEDGHVIFGPVEDAYRDYLIMLNRWYEEGIVYPDFYTIPDGQDINYTVEHMSTGKSALCQTYNEFAGQIELEDGEYLEAGYLPRINENSQVHLTEGVDALVKSVWYLGGNCTEEEIQMLCMMMNYFYTEEGALFANYGIEGVSYEFQEDGTPWYTEMITNNPDGLSQTQALVYYIGYMAPCYADYSKYNISSLTTWAEFTEAWGTADNEWDMPSAYMTTAETDIYSAVSGDVDTYMDETIVKFIIGDLDPSDDEAWNKYVSTMKELGVQDMIDVKQAAMDRYNAA